MRKFSLFFIFLIGWFICLVTGCQSPGRTVSASTGQDSIKYASGFTVNRCDGYTQVDVRNPWDTTLVLQRYLLVDSGLPLPSALPEGVVVCIPLKRIVVYNAVHCSMLARLGAETSVVGVCEPEYIKSEYIERGIADGSIVNLGESHAPNIEAILELAPQAIVASPIKNVGYGTVSKLKTPIIECTDYMERTPLGQAEWIRFLALFLGKDEQADSLFRATEKAYLDVKSLAASASYRPTVFSEMKIGSVWYTAGGRSFMANLFADAGADYIWQADSSTGSNPLSFESVFDRAAHADFWLIKYNNVREMTYASLKSDYSPYADFDAYQKRNIFICNTGENDYYEMLPQSPDVILKEFVAVFHPELLPEHVFRFYKKMNE